MSKRTRGNADKGSAPAQQVGWIHKVLFGKRVSLAFKPKQGLGVFLLGIPIFGVLRFAMFDMTNPEGDIFWVVFMSISVGLIATFTSYFDE